MKRRTRLVLSIASGVLAVAVSLLYASSVRGEAEQAQREALERYGGETVPVCVALRDIDAGETVDDANVRVEEWVASLLPEGAATSLKDVAGKTATSRIPARAALSSRYFEREEDAIEVPRGRVAVSVASDAEHAVGGGLVKGETVDVYVSADSLADRLASAQVIDTSVLANAGGELTWVTLAVEEERVPELLAAASRAMVTLTVSGGRAGTEGKD